MNKLTVVCVCQFVTKEYLCHLFLGYARAKNWNLIEIKLLYLNYCESLRRPFFRAFKIFYR